MQKTWKAKCKRQWMYMKSFPHKCLLSIYCSRPTYWFHWLAGRGQHAAAVRWHLGFCCGDIECGHQFSYDETLLMVMCCQASSDRFWLGRQHPGSARREWGRGCATVPRAHREAHNTHSTKGSFEIRIKTPLQLDFIFEWEYKDQSLIQ